MGEQTKCQLCGEPMPDGEGMFHYHGYSGPCPKPPLPKPIPERTYTQAELNAAVQAATATAMVQQREADADAIELRKVGNQSLDPDSILAAFNVRLQEVATALRNAPITSAPAHEWLERHDRDIYAQGIAQGMATQAEMEKIALERQLAAARLSEHGVCEVCMRDPSNCIRITQLEAEAQALASQKEN